MLDQRLRVLLSRDPQEPLVWSTSGAKTTRNLGLMLIQHVRISYPFSTQSLRNATQAEAPFMQLPKLSDKGTEREKRYSLRLRSHLRVRRERQILMDVHKLERGTYDLQFVC